MIKQSVLFLITCLFFLIEANAQKRPLYLQLGYSTAISNVTSEKMAYAKSAGITFIEVTLSELVDSNRRFKFSDEEIIQKVKLAKKAANDAGITIWSVHTPYGKNIDISLSDEGQRQEVVALHKKVLLYCKLLKPNIILFHPSWYLSLNDRELHKSQMVRSAIELNAAVRVIDATMVIENMLGPELLANLKLERPLCRTVEETVEIMNRLPANIYSAIDLNHIKEPEKLIMAMGTRLKTLHVSDGTGLKEDHFFPCSGKGNNNWVKILTALNDVKYQGPFMFECAYSDVKDFKPCYDTMYAEFLASVGFKTD